MKGFWILQSCLAQNGCYRNCSCIHFKDLKEGVSHNCQKPLKLSSISVVFSSSDSITKSKKCDDIHKFLWYTVHATSRVVHSPCYSPCGTQSMLLPLKHRGLSFSHNLTLRVSVPVMNRPTQGQDPLLPVTQIEFRVFSLQNRPEWHVKIKLFHRHCRSNLSKSFLITFGSFVSFICPLSHH
jgi:hypothetical protein